MIGGGWFSGLRAIALLRRIARAEERRTEIAEERLAMEQARFEREYPRRQKPRPAEFGVADVASLNAAYRRDHPRLDDAEMPAEEGEV